MLIFDSTLLYFGRMTLRNYLFILLLTSFHTAVGQTNQRKELARLQNEIRQASYYDSATVFEKGERGIALARKLHSKRDEALIFQYYGNFEYFSGNVKRANYFYEKCIDLARIAKNQELINSTKIRQTFIDLDTNVVGAERHFHQLLNEAKKRNFYKNQIEIYNGLGILHEEKVMTDRSLYFYHSGLRIAEKHHQTYMTSFLLNNIGLLKFNNKQLQEAKKDLERGLQLSKTLNEPRLTLNLLNNLGLVYSDLNDSKQAIIHYKQTVIEAKKIGFPNGIFAAYLNLSSNYLEANKIKEAQENLDSAQLLIKHISDPNYIGALFIQAGKIDVKRKNYSHLKDQIIKLEKHLKTYPDALQLYELLNLKVSYAVAKNDYKKAFSLQRKLANISDSISTLSNQHELSKLQTIYGKERIEDELQDVKSKNKLLQTESRLKTANFQLFGTVFVLIIVIVLAFIYIQYIRKTKAVREKFAKNLLVKIDEERSRISKDLHDDIGQALSIIKSKINLHQKGTIQHLDGVENEIGQVINQTRKISHELHPSGIEKIGLVKMLQNMLEKVEGATGIFTSMDWDFSDEILDRNQQAQIYRMLQECTNNTLKHAQANALKIQAILKKETMEILYMDNGIGLKNSPIKQGLGFQTIEERVAILGGKFEVKQNHPNGLLFRFQIPRL